jgi:putative flippase GtrA
MRRIHLFAKYSLAGVVNSLVGYAVIFGCMLAGVDATTSNVAGYAVGLVTSYLQSRFWVFRSGNAVFGETLRFLLGFLVAFLANFAVLKSLLAHGTNAYLAQAVACIVYIVIGFLLASAFVFSKRK